MPQIDPDQWPVLGPLLDRALDLSGADRDAWIRALAAQSPELVRPLADLLSAEARADERGFPRRAASDQPRRTHAGPVHPPAPAWTRRDGIRVAGAKDRRPLRRLRGGEADEPRPDGGDRTGALPARGERKVRAARAERWCRSRATSSFPVPVSPTMRTVAGVGATRSTSRSAARSLGSSPISAVPEGFIIPPAADGDRRAGV